MSKMAILNKEDFFSHLNDMVGNDTSDKAISFIEDMTDTYNDLENRLAGDGENWEQKYNDLNESWKAKYRSRFFSSGGRSNIPQETPDPDRKDPKDIKIDDLFS